MMAHRVTHPLKSGRPKEKEIYRCTDRNVRSKRMSLIQDLSGEENDGSFSDPRVDKVSFGKKDMDGQQDSETTSNGEYREGQEVCSKTNFAKYSKIADCCYSEEG